MAGTDGWVSVSLPYVSGAAGDAWAAEAAQAGRTGTQRLREVAEVVAPAEVNAALGLAAGDLAVVRRRLILLDGRPVELADSYYPTAIARGTRLADPRRIPGGAVALLAELGHVPDRIQEDVSARPADPVERGHLELDAGEWVLVLARTLTSAAGRPIEASVLTMTAAGRRLRYRLSL